MYFLSISPIIPILVTTNLILLNIEVLYPLYLLLLTHQGEKQDKLFKEFEEKYNKLSKEKQEYIREDLKKIFEEQDKNNKEKEKRL